jgi:hypothetical protein
MKMCKFLDNILVIDQALLQLYTLVLIFTLKRSIVRIKYSS